MTFERITASQFAADLTAAIQRRDAEQDTGLGPIRDVVIEAPSEVFELVDGRTVDLSNLVALDDPDAFTTAFLDDLDAVLLNERVVRAEGARFSTTLTFSTQRQPQTDLVVARNHPVGTLASSERGSSVVFITTEERTLPAGTPANADGFYTLDVPAIAVIAGTTGRVAANRLQRSLRPLAGFSAVTNRQASEGGRDAETNREVIDRYFLSVTGARLTGKRGLERAVLTQFPEAIKVRAVTGGDSPRAATVAGAVDVYHQGEQLLQATDLITYPGASQVLPLSLPPVTSVTEVRVVTTGTAVAQSDGTTDGWELVQDATFNAGSTAAIDGVRVRGTPAGLTIGDLIAVVYRYDNLNRAMQVAFTGDQDDLDVHGRAELFLRRVDVAVSHAATLTVRNAQNRSRTLSQVEEAVRAFFASLDIGADVEESDIQAAVRAIPNVDNYVTTLLVRAPDVSGRSDLPIAANELAVLADLDIS